MVQSFLLSPNTQALVPAGSAQLAELSPHPQLLLDKWTRVARNGVAFSLKDTNYETPRKDTLESVIKASAALDPPDTGAITRRERHFTAPLKKLGEEGLARSYYLDMETSSPLALHLSRSNPLENASACLHRQWGCPYLPGSGLKGAGANAGLYRLNDAYPGLIVRVEGKKEVHGIRFNLQAIPKAERHKAAIAALSHSLIYGFSPTDRATQSEEEGRRRMVPSEGRGVDVFRWLFQELTEEGSSPDEAPIPGDDTLLGAFTGAVIFWDALPPAGARTHLEVDVLTPHAGDYYSGKAPTPDERQSPKPVTFLVARGLFRVAVSLRRIDDRLGEPFDRLRSFLQSEALSPQTLLQIAAHDIESALTKWGFGAKTAAGYGQFKASYSRKVQEPAQAPQAVGEEDLTTLVEFKASLEGRDLSPSNPHERGEVHRALIQEVEDLQANHPPIAEGLIEALRDAMEGKKLSRNLKKFLK